MTTSNHHHWDELSLSHHLRVADPRPASIGVFSHASQKPARFFGRQHMSDLETTRHHGVLTTIFKHASGRSFHFQRSGNHLHSSSFFSGAHTNSLIFPCFLSLHARCSEAFFSLLLNIRDTSLPVGQATSTEPYRGWVPGGHLNASTTGREHCQQSGGLLSFTFPYNCFISLVKDKTICSNAQPLGPGPRQTHFGFSISRFFCLSFLFYVFHILIFFNTA